MVVAAAVVVVQAASTGGRSGAMRSKMTGALGVKQ